MSILDKLKNLFASKFQPTSTVVDMHECSCCNGCCSEDQEKSCNCENECQCDQNSENNKDNDSCECGGNCGCSTSSDSNECACGHCGK